MGKVIEGEVDQSDQSFLDDEQVCGWLFLWSCEGHGMLMHCQELPMLLPIGVKFAYYGLGAQNFDRHGVPIIVQSTYPSSTSTFLSHQMNNGYSLLCVAYATSDCVIETNKEEELY